MEPLRERMAIQVRKAIFKAEAWAVDEVVPEITDAIMQAVEEDRAKLKEWHEEIAQSQQRWRSRAEQAEAREAALVAALRVQLGNLGELRREIEIENRPHLLRIIDRWADAIDAALAVKEGK